MINTGKLAGKTLFITGASRGIGKAIALKAAKDGANIVIAAKTAQAHPKLPGTIYTAAKEVEEAGGRCLPCIVDIREESQVAQAVEGAVKQFGGIDILVNNASAISLTPTLDTDMKRYDLMHNINTRGTFLTSKLCIPHLKKAQNPHILNLSPPLSIIPRWFKSHVAYTMAKYGMSMCVLGMAEELKEDGIAVNALWPRTAIWTAAMDMIGGKDISNVCRTVDIVADAAYAILSKDSRSFTGNFCIDDKVLAQAGITNFDQYAVSPGNALLTDFFLSDEELASAPGGGKFVSSPESLPEKPAEPQQTTGSSSSSSSDVESMFMKLKGHINEELVKQTSSLYLFQIKGDKAGPYYIDLKNGAGTVAKGEPSEKVDVTFTTDEETYKKMFDGSLKATSAFMSGKLRMKGDMGKAMKLEKLMSKLKSKL